MEEPHSLPPFSDLLFQSRGVCKGLHTSTRNGSMTWNCNSSTSSPTRPCGVLLSRIEYRPLMVGGQSKPPQISDPRVRFWDADFSPQRVSIIWTQNKGKWLKNSWGRFLGRSFRAGGQLFGHGYASGHGSLIKGGGLHDENSKGDKGRTAPGKRGMRTGFWCPSHPLKAHRLRLTCSGGLLA